MKLNKLYTYPGMILYYFFLLLGILILFQFNKGEGIIWLNESGNSISDIFFKYWTYLGDGLVFLIVLVFFVFRSYFYFFITISSIIIQTIFVQGLKRYVFQDLVRPKLFIENFMDLRQVEGVEIHSQHTFPSGHTATAFTIALILSLYVKNKSWTVVFMLAAILVGISRMYLLQHFFVDIYFGSVFGVLSVILSFYLIGNSEYLKRRLSEKSKLTGR